ncbi:MAG: DUF5752 family protein [Candidatus Woesearchaeota archaeon]
MNLKEKASVYLSDVASEYVFWLCDRRTLKNLEQLSDALADMNDDVFRYHVNSEKNDFANWIYNIIGDKQLASSIRKLKTKKAIHAKIKERLLALKGAK